MSLLFTHFLEIYNELNLSYLPPEWNEISEVKLNLEEAQRLLNYIKTKKKEKKHECKK